MDQIQNEKISNRTKSRMDKIQNGKSWNGQNPKLDQLPKYTKYGLIVYWLDYKY